MKLLFLDVDVRYMNPTRSLIRALLKESAETVIYGPGYTPVDVLARGLAEFVDREGPFDFVITNELSGMYAETIAAEPWRLRDRHTRVTAGALAALRDIAAWLREYRGRTLVLLLEFDAFNLSAAQVEWLNDTNAWYAVLWDRHLMESIEDSPDLRHEPYAAEANDNFFKFVCANEERVFALPHFVADDEFAWGSVEDREPVWNVPGATYHYRRMARQTLAARGLLRRQFPWMQSYAMLARIGARPYAHGLLMSLYNRQFQLAIEASRYCYTCGSAQHMHIRKHVEIPARGAVLVTAPIRGLESMGFEDGVNCFVRMPADLPALHADLERDPALAQSVAAAGRELIWSSHRLASRARQLRGCLDAIAAGQFAGASWNRGQLTVRTLAPYA